VSEASDDSTGPTPPCPRLSCRNADSRLRVPADLGTSSTVRFQTRERAGPRFVLATRSPDSGRSRSGTIAMTLSAVSAIVVASGELQLTGRLELGRRRTTWPRFAAHPLEGRLIQADGVRIGCGAVGDPMSRVAAEKDQSAGRRPALLYPKRGERDRDFWCVRANRVSRVSLDVGRAITFSRGRRDAAYSGDWGRIVWDGAQPMPVRESPGE